MKQDIYEQNAVELLELMKMERDFEVGDFVTWKDERLKKTITPAMGQRVLVTEIIDPPIRNSFVSPGSQYFYDLLDFRFLICGEDGDWLEYSGSSKYFRKA